MIPISVGIADGWPQIVLASMIISADVLSKNPNWGRLRNEGKVNCSDVDFNTAISKYARLVQYYSGDSLEILDYEQMREAFYEAKAAMLPLGSWIVGEIDSMNLNFTPGFFPVPGDESAQTVSIWQNEGLSISANTKHPEECLDFIRYFMTDSIWYSTFLQSEAVFSNSTTKIIYPMSRFRRELGNQLINLRAVEHWYDMTGDRALLPGLQSYFEGMTERIATGSDIDFELQNFDLEWDKVRIQMTQ
jgi:ABC-type glycerol-3-phosphate transport system substrate-binding protein